MPKLSGEISKSGSMIQEIFCDRCKHFVASLPKQHEPVILFLNGHTSQWNKEAVKHLLDNNLLFVFFGEPHVHLDTTKQAQAEQKGALDH